MLSRRRFLRGAAGTLAMPAFLQPFAAEAAGSNTILVAIAQAGGCDGLNTVVPLGQYGAYSTLRTPSVAPGNANLALNIPLASLQATAFDPSPATPATSASQYAFNPTMTSMRQLYATGNLAVVTGIGVVPDEPNRLSHEVGQFDWASGTIKQLGRTTNGWVGLSLDSVTGGTLPPMVSMTGQSPTLMNGKAQMPLVLGVPLESFHLNTGSSGTDATQRSAFYAEIQTEQLPDPAGEFVRGVATSAAGFVQSIAGIAQQTATFDYPQTKTFLDAQLREIARLIVTGTGVRAYYAVHGGYDTHANQNLTHPILVGQLSDALATFYRYLRGKGKSSNVVIATFTDFGRRPKANDTYGTDHGSTSVNFILGDPVRGGLYGQYPSLTSLDSNNNLQVQVDFRNQISDLIQYLGADPAAILGRAYPKLGML